MHGNKLFGENAFPRSNSLTRLTETENTTYNSISYGLAMELKFIDVEISVLYNRSSNLNSHKLCRLCVKMLKSIS